MHTATLNVPVCKLIKRLMAATFILALTFKLTISTNLDIFKMEWGSFSSCYIFVVLENFNAVIYFSFKPVFFSTMLDLNGF